MAKDPDTGRQEGDAVGRHANDGKDQNDYEHSDSGNSGGSTTTQL